MNKKKWGILATVFVFCLFFSYYQNNKLSVSSFNLPSEKITENIKVIQLSDLHSKQFGKNQQRLVKMVKQKKPDLIVFTGDLIDSKKYKESASILLMEQLVNIAPTYYVTGNHEMWSGKYEKLEKKLLEVGVTVLRNEGETVHVNGVSIHIVGIDDPDFSAEEDDVAIEQELEQAFQTLDATNGFTLLLSHRPELLSVYQEWPIDLVLTGHAHGGQVRIPFIGGLVAPNQGFFPKYTAGKHQRKKTTMIVNRGLGNSIIPQRVFNTPEIVEVILSAKE